MSSIKTYVEMKSRKVFFIITYRGKRFQVSTGVDSDAKFSGLDVPRTVTNWRTKTSTLARLYSSIEAYMMENPSIPSAQMKDNIKSIIAGKEMEAEKNLLYYFCEYVKTKTKKGTVEIYERTMRRIEAYDNKCTYDTIDRSWLERFQAHELAKGRMQNGIAIDLRNIRTIFNWGIDNEFTTKYPFRKFKIASERQQYLYLGAKEMKEYRDYPLEPFMEKYRDLFMLGFYLIGINISDLLELPSGCIKNGRIQYRRNKTARLYDIKVEPEAMEIINKYRGTKHLLSILDDGTKEESFRRTINDYLKRVGKVEYRKNKRGALIKKEITPLHPDIVWYTARRSWATIAASLDIPKEVIGKALGHSEWDNTTTDLYIQFDHKKIDDANRKVIDHLNSI
jgi:site-specific recombinase XerD